jgi:hypothetical protein
MTDMIGDYEVEVVPLSELAQHKLARDGENIIGEYLVVITGTPRGDAQEAKDALRDLLFINVATFGRGVGKFVHSAHTRLHDFDPKEYFK